MVEWGALPLGVLVGFLGSLTGLGGGFLLMPVLLLLYPRQPAAALSSLTMAAVFFNSLGGVVPSLFRDRVRWRWALMFSLFSLPLVVVGVEVQALVSRSSFTLIFSAVLFLLGLFYLFSPVRTASEVAGERPSSRHFKVGLGLSVVIGFFSGFLGIGGSFLFVPLFLLLLRLTPQEAVSTTQLILALGSATVLVLNLIQGRFLFLPWITLFLLSGIALGTLGGTFLLGKLSGRFLLRLVAVLLVVLAVKLAVFP